LFHTPRTSSFIGQEVEHHKKVASMFHEMIQYNQNMHVRNVGNIKVETITTKYYKIIYFWRVDLK
jgi:hypothetical protein